MFRAGQSGDEAVIFSQTHCCIGKESVMARTKTLAVPEVGSEAPEFHLPSAQGGQLRLGMRTARGPVVVVFYSGGWSGEDIAYFKDLASKEDEINLAAASVVGIGRGEPQAARDFVRETGIKSYVLYDYAGIATSEYGLLEKDKEHGEYARPATFIVDSDHKVAHAWVGERPKAEEILAKVSEITGLPKPAEEETAEEEKPKRPRKAAKGANDGEAGESRAEEERPKKPSPEEREKRRAGRRAARSEDNDGESRSEE
jgi:peroxiredoxin